MSTDSPNWMRRRRAAGVVGPLLLMAFQIVGTFGAAHGQESATSPDALAVVLVAAGPLSLLVVRRWPRGVLAFIATVTLTYLALGYPYGPVFAAFVGAVLINILFGHRYWAWAALAVMVVLSTLVRLTARDEVWSWAWAGGVVAWALVIAVVGELLRVRRTNAIEAHRVRQEIARRQAGEERLRIARELHDVVAHHMSLINVQAGVALHLVDRKPDQVETALRTIKDASKEAMNELRSLIGVLRADDEAAPRMPVATLRSLDELVSRSAQAGVQVQVTTDGDLETIPAAVELAAFRIIQEAMTNVVRHSGSRTADISVQVGPESVEVSIVDSGHRPPKVEEGNGLRGMRERAQVLGGSLSSGPGQSGGTAITAKLPFGGRP